MEIRTNLESKKTLLTEELWYLIQLCGSTTVIGIENPYIGYSIEEIEIAEQFTLISLLRKNIVNVTNGAVEISTPVIKSTIETCVNPQHCLWLIAVRNNRPDLMAQRFLYFAGEHIVGLEKSDQRTYRLTDIQNDTLGEILKGYFPDPANPQPAGTSFVLSQPVFDKVSNDFSSGNQAAARRALAEVGVDAQACEELAAALSDDHNYYLAINIHHPMAVDKCYTEGVGYVQGKNGGWAMREYEENGIKNLHFQPAGLPDFLQMILPLIK
ncbi:MAG: hypothetical protein VB089_04760 [Anaerolineaceae bacterium]|nr:hypothetical protein [Anaerolineaceae bacterium]